MTPQLQSIRVRTDKLPDGSWTWSLVGPQGDAIKSGRSAFMTREMAEQTGVKQAQLEQMAQQLAPMAINGRQGIARR